MRFQLPHNNFLLRLGRFIAHGLHRGKIWSDLTHAPVHRRVRGAMYAVLLVVGAVSAWQAVQVEKAESVRLADAEIIQLAGNQSTLSQRMGMLAALLALSDGIQEEYRNALEETIHQSQMQATRLEELLKRQGVWQAGAAPSLRQSASEWQDRRERLWYRAQLLLWHSERLDSSRLVQAIKALRHEVDFSLLTTQKLVEEVQLAAQLRARKAVGQIEYAALIMILLLLALTFGVAEPLARFVKRQYQTLFAQSQELKRLALVAERTSNWVAVLDAQRRLLWGNLAFLRGKGGALEELAGKSPGLLSSAQNNPEEIARLMAELDRGLGVRTEIHTRSGEGQDIWLDVDYQPIHEGDAITGFTVVAVDVTERVNERLRMKALLEVLPIGVVLLSITGRVIESNREATRMLDLGRGELIGRAALARDGVAVRDDLSPYPAGERPSARTLRTGQGLRGESVGQLSPKGSCAGCWSIPNPCAMRRGNWPAWCGVLWM